MGVGVGGMGRGSSMLQDPEAKDILNTVQELKAGQGDQSQSERRWGARRSSEVGAAGRGLGFRLGAVGQLYTLSKKRKSAFQILFIRISECLNENILKSTGERYFLIFFSNE